MEHVISWKAMGPLSPEDWGRMQVEVSETWRASGLLLAYEWDFPFPISDSDIAGVPWAEVYARGRWGGGAGGITEFPKLLEDFVVNIWPSAKVAGEVAGAGFLAKAGADAWGLCVRGLKRGLPAVLARTKRVEVDVVYDAAPENDLLYEIYHHDLDTLDEAIEAIAKHAQRVHSGEAEGIDRSERMRWSGHSHCLELVRWNPLTQGWDSDEPSD
jgi:hypothetical protein